MFMTTEDARTLSREELVALLATFEGNLDHPDARLVIAELSRRNAEERGEEPGE